MATFRAAYPVFAPLNFDNETNEPIGYGNGVVIGRLMNVSTTDTYQIGTALSNFKHRFDSSAISLGTSEIGIDAAIKMFGFKKDGNHLTAPMMSGIPGGFGYIKGEIIKGKVGFAVEFHRFIVFTPPSRSAVTQGNSVNFTTPSITGYGLSLDGSPDDTYYFDTFAEALTYLKGLAKIE